MSQANELLNSLANSGIESRVANPELEPHIVVDNDRIVTVPDELQRIAVQFDHNIETVTFDCPRYWDGHDMSEMKIYINYRCPDGTLGSYIADDVTVDEEDDTIIHFKWTISKNVAKVNGRITFLICIKKMEKHILHCGWRDGGVVDATFTDLTYGNGVFAGITTRGIYASTNGIDWRLVRGSDGKSEEPYCGISYIEEQFIAFDQYGIYSSKDAITWAKATLSGATKLPLRSVTYGNEKCLALNSNGGGYYSVKSGSVHAGSTWTSFSNSVLNGASYVAYGNTKFVAVGSAGTAYYSNDGVVWTAVSVPSNILGDAYGIIYADNKFVATTSAGLAHSYDGITWKSCPGVVNPGKKCLTYAYDMFIAVGYDAGAIEYSEDGVTWNTATGKIDIPPTSGIAAIAYGGDECVAVGTTGHCYYVESPTEEVESNHWNSELNQDICISEGLECDTVLETVYPDIYTQLLYRMDEHEVRCSNYVGTASDYARDSAISANESAKSAEESAKSAEESAKSAEESAKSAEESAESASDAKTLLDTTTGILYDVNEKLETGYFIGPPGIQGPQGEKGDQGPQGVKGDKGDTGESGVTTPIEGFFNVAVDDEGNLWSYSAEGGTAPEFAYDSVSGNLYFANDVDVEQLITRPMFVYVDDDGVSSFKTIYDNIVQPRGIVGGLSIITDTFNGGDFTYLTQEEILDFQDKGWTILNHSCDGDTITKDNMETKISYAVQRFQELGYENRHKIFVYPNGNTATDSTEVVDYIKDIFNFGLDATATLTDIPIIGIEHKFSIGRVFVQDLTDESKMYIKSLVDEAISGNKLMVISTHSYNCDQKFLAELFDYIIEKGGEFYTPDEALDYIYYSQEQSVSDAMDKVYYEKFRELEDRTYSKDETYAKAEVYNKNEVNNMLSGYCGLGRFCRITSAQLLIGPGSTTPVVFGYPAGFNKDNCRVMCVYTIRASDHVVNNGPIANLVTIMNNDNITINVKNTISANYPCYIDIILFRFH